MGCAVQSSQVTAMLGVNTCCRGSPHAASRAFCAMCRPGVYMMDVVVEFSSSIAASSLAFYKQQAAYEGNPIPGSPFRVAVHPNPSLAAKQKRQVLGTEGSLATPGLLRRCMHPTCTCACGSHAPVTLAMLPCSLYAPGKSWAPRRASGR